MMVNMVPRIKPRIGSRMIAHVGIGFGGGVCIIIYLNLKIK
jgi:hypothetical protein